MHTIWQRSNQRNNGQRNGNRSLSAVLVDHYSEDGRLKEKIIKPLATIEERFLETKITGTRAFHQGLFWVAVDRELNSLKLEPSLRAKIEADILEKVPRPDWQWALWGVTCIPKFDR